MLYLNMAQEIVLLGKYCCKPIMYVINSRQFFLFERMMMLVPLRYLPAFSLDQW